MKEQYIKFYSPTLDRSLDLLINGHWGYPILMFPTSCGSAFQNRDMGLLHSIENHINSGTIITFNIASIDGESFYNHDIPNDQKIFNYNLYTQFLVTELIPEIRKQTNVHRIGVAGCSFGAYHALNLAYKYPDIVNFAIGMSGNYDIKSFMGNFYNDNVYFNNPVDYMQNTESWRYNHLKTVIGTSEWDICREPSLRFSNILSHQNINHFYDEKRWANHDWPLWNMAFPEYLNKVL